MPPGRNGPEYTCASGIIKYALEQERDPFRYIEQPMDQLKPQKKFIGVIGKPSGRGQYQPDDEETTRERQGSILQSIKEVFKELF
jgi:cell division protein FtsA